MPGPILTMNVYASDFPKEIETNWWKKKTQFLEILMRKLDDEIEYGNADYIYAEVKDSRGVSIEDLDGTSWEMAFIMAWSQWGKGYADKTLLKDAYYKPKASHRDHPKSKIVSLKNIAFSGSVGGVEPGPGDTMTIHFDPVPDLAEKELGAVRIDCKFITAVSHDHKYHAMEKFNLHWPF